MKRRRMLEYRKEEQRFYVVEESVWWADRANKKLQHVERQDIAGPFTRGELRTGSSSGVIFDLVQEL